MLIAIDYDETYSENPDFWDKFIFDSRANGYNVICVTLRYPEETWDIEDTIGQLCKIIYTCRKAKKPFVNNLGIYPNIWIDDSPEYIHNDHNDKRLFRR